MIVIDASALAIAVIDDDAHGNRARERLSQSHSLHAPELIDLEVLSLVRRQVGAGLLSEHRAGLAMADLVDLPLVRYPHVAFAWRIWELRHNLTPYDGAYVALAEALECTLITADAGIARTPRIHCRVEILGR